MRITAIALIKYLGYFIFRWVCQAYQEGEGSSTYQRDHLKNLNTQYRYVY